jgi:hypothetical protein
MNWALALIWAAFLAAFSITAHGDGERARLGYRLPSSRLIRANQSRDRFKVGVGAYAQ